MSSKILGSLSPAYGLISGKGAFGKLGASGLAGVVPALIAADRKDRKEQEAAQTGRPASNEEKEAMARKFMAGASAGRGAGMRGKNSGIAIPRSGEAAGMKSGGKLKKYRDGGIYTADMGKPPQDIDGGSAPKKAMPAPKKIRGEGTRKMPVPTKPAKEPKKYAKGGSIDGCAQRGKTDCKMR